MKKTGDEAQAGKKHTDFRGGPAAFDSLKEEIVKDEGLRHGNNQQDDAGDKSEASGAGIALPIDQGEYDPCQIHKEDGGLGQ